MDERSPASGARAPSRRLNREILALAIPNFLSSVTVPLVGLFDTALVGRLGDVALIGAVSVGAIIFDTLYWAFGFLRMGSTALVAQAYGAGDDRRAGQVLLQSAAIGLVLGISMVVLREPVASLGVRLAGPPDDVAPWARAYVLVRILGGPAVLMTYALNGFFRGMKDSVTPLVVTIVVNGLNIFGNFVLIFGYFGFPALGVVGAAWASFIGAMAGFVVAIVVALVRYGHAWRPALVGALTRDGLFHPARVGVMLTTHVSLFLRTLFLLAAYFLMVAVAGRLGAVPLAANAIILQLWHISSYSVDGVAFAAETLVGNALGAQDGSGARRMGTRTLLWGVCLALPFSLAYLVAMEPIGRLFTPESTVVAAMVAITWVTVVAQPMNAVAFIYDGIFIGANDMRYLFYQMAVSFFVVFLPGLWLFVGKLGWGLEGLWLTMMLFMVARAVTLHWRYRQESWLQRRLVAARW